MTRLGPATLPSVVLNRLLGRNVFLFQDSSSAWINRLAILSGAATVDFSMLPAVDVRDVYGDLHDAGTRTLATIWRGSAAPRLTALLAGIDDAERKLKVLVRTFIDARCTAAALMSTWGRCAVNRYPRVVITGPLDGISAQYLKNASRQFRLGPLAPLYHALDTAAKVISKLARRGRKGAREASRAKRPEKRMLPGFVAGPEPIDSPVMYFPHKTISYGGLFLKDQFYAEDPQSPFHSSKLIHVELQPIEQSWCSRELADAYENLGIRYCYLDAGGGANLTRSVFRYLRLLRTIGAVGGALASPRLTYIVFRQWRSFESYRASLERFPLAKIALVGYEMLFPAALSLALESKGIRTMATQERLLASTCYRNWNYILDTYLVASTRVANHILADPGKYVGTLVPIGLVRGDLIRRFETDDRPDRRGARTADDSTANILVFDFHSVRDQRTNARALVNNWRANRAFYEDVIALARTFPEVRFTIRSKNRDWQAMPAFADIVDAMAELPNIDPGRNLGQMLVSYRLAAESDAVIARHTSIADECMAAAVPTILHDYLPNAQRTVSLAWDYAGVEVFVNTYEELVERVSQTLSRGHFLDNDAVGRLQAVVNDGPADGKVRSRIARELNRLWVEVNRGDDCRPRAHLAV